MRKYGIRLLALCMLTVLFVFGCGQGTEENKSEKEIYAMDTIMTLTLYGDKAEETMNEAVSLIHRYDSLFSVTEPDSDISKINSASGAAVTVSPETYELVQKCLEVSADTEGLFDISIYPLVKAWGFTTENQHVPSEDERETAMKKIDYTRIRLLEKDQIQIDPGMQIDLGAAAKGYLSQKLMELCQEKGVSSAIVSLGGNVQTMGTKADGSFFRVGITDPSDGTSLYGTIQVKDKAVITSGIYQRYFTEGEKTYHHIMDKRTGMPAENDLASVTVIAEDGGKADALATALYVMGEEKAKAYQKEHPELQLVLIRKDGSCWQSAETGMSREESR